MIASPKCRQVSAQKTLAVAALARGETHGQAGEVAGVSARTIGRWTEDPMFASLVREAVACSFASALAKLSGGAVGAAGYLVDVATGKMRGDPQRVNASRLVLTLAVDLRESVDLAERLTAVEASIAERNREEGP